MIIGGRTKTGPLRVDRAAAHRDGKWLLRTSDQTLTPDDLAYAYKAAQRRRTRLAHGPAARQRPHHRIPGKNRYRLTGDRLRFAIFYTKPHDRLLRPLLAADQPPAPPPLRKAPRTIDTHIAERIDAARLPLNAARKLKTGLNDLATKGRYAAAGTTPGGGGPSGSTK
jgi:hypothetical protein